MPYFVDMDNDPRSYIPLLILLGCFAFAYIVWYIYIIYFFRGHPGTLEAVPAAGSVGLEGVPDPGSLPATVYSVADEGDNAECSICLEEFETGNTVKVLPPCSHVYHSICIDGWLSGHSECPLCRLPIWEDPHVV